MEYPFTLSHTSGVFSPKTILNDSKFEANTLGYVTLANLYIAAKNEYILNTKPHNLSIIILTIENPIISTVNFQINRCWCYIFHNILIFSRNIELYRRNTSPKY